MNHNGPELDTQLRHLLDVVSENRDKRCTASLERARRQADQTIKHAYHEARQQMHKHVLETRHTVQQQLKSAQARSQTRLRLHKQRADGLLLQRAWEPLREQMKERWRDTETRKLWVDSLIRQAMETLISSPWLIEHPADWPVTEQTGLRERLSASVSVEPVFSAEQRIQAGLRICAGQACVDGTLEGLLRSQARIEGMLLAKLNECRSELAAASREHQHE